jgi:hypothetical protein
LDIESYAGENQRAHVSLRGSLVDHNREVGVFIAGATVTIDSTVIQDTQPDGYKVAGRGVGVQPDPSGEQRAVFTLLASRVERNFEMGVFLQSSDATIQSSVIRDTAAQADGTFGDGIVLFAEGAPVNAAITNSEIGSNARAGISSFGGTVSLVSTVLSCNAFDLDAETYLETEASFPESKQNLCDCPTPIDNCHIVSTQVMPPAGLDPAKPPGAP